MAGRDRRNVLVLIVLVATVAVLHGCSRRPSPRAVQVFVAQRISDALAPVAGAQVSLVPPPGGEEFSDVTDTTGAVLFERVPGGVRYGISVTASGFADYSGQLPPDTVPVQGVVTQFVVLTPATG